jgi:hypothetical protein
MRRIECWKLFAVMENTAVAILRVNIYRMVVFGIRKNGNGICKNCNPEDGGSMFVRNVSI